MSGRVTLDGSVQSELVVLLGRRSLLFGMDIIGGIVSTRVTDTTVL